MKRHSAFRLWAALALLWCGVAAAWAQTKEVAATAQVNGIDPVLLAKAKAGDADAENSIGYSYARLGNMEEAHRWQLRAAQNGNVTAMGIVAGDFELARGIPQDYSQAFFWYRKRAEQGDAEAEDNLGGMYEDGQVVQQSLSEAAFWYRKAAVQGSAYGQYNLACLYVEGRGLVQDYVQAAFWYRKAADQGHAGAQAQLGQLYDSGQGVPQNYAEAAIWFRKAADQGNAGAQYRLGSLYADGHGFARDYLEAYFWVDIAAALERDKDLKPAAVAKRDWVAGMLTSSQITEVQARVTKWFTEHPAPPCIQVNDRTTTCYKTAQDMEQVINSQKEKP